MSGTGEYDDRFKASMHTPLTIPSFAQVVAVDRDYVLSEPACTHTHTHTHTMHTCSDHD